MKLFSKTAAWLLVLVLCATMFIPAFATETEEGEPAEEETTVQSNGFLEVNETVYAVTNSNIRSGPGTQYAVIGNLLYGHAITRIGIGDKGWSMVIYRDRIAYIFTDLLSTTRPKDYTWRIDGEALMVQIAIANGLTRYDYTDASWAALTSALANANVALNGNSQNAADAAEQALKDAISALVRMDYSDLEEAIAETRKMVANAPLGDAWFKLSAELEAAQAQLTSGSQSAVDEATDRLEALLEEMRLLVERGMAPEVITQEVPVEVPPTDDYCNIPMHRIWPVMFFVSLVLNVAFLAVILIYVYQKKKNRTDDMPLVDYDIMDDTL